MGQKYRKEESGEMMLEGVFAITVVLLVLMLLLSLGFYLYQRTVVDIVTNEIAEEVAQTYKFKEVSGSSNITADNVKSVGRYRYFMVSGGVLRKKNVQRAKNLIDRRLPETSLARSASPAKVEIERITSDIGRCHYKVTVKKKYNFLFEGALRLAGIDTDGYITCTAYSESVDISNYVNTVRLAEYATNEVVDGVPALKMVNSVIKTMNSVWGIFHKDSDGAFGGGGSGGGGFRGWDTPDEGSGVSAGGGGSGTSGGGGSGGGFRGGDTPDESSGVSAGGGGSGASGGGGSGGGAR